MVHLLYGSSLSKKKGKREGKEGRDHSNITCFGCGKQGHIRRKCPDGEKDEKRDEKEDKRDNKSTPAKGSEEASPSKHCQGRSTR